MRKHRKGTVMADDRNQKDGLDSFDLPSTFLEEIAIDRRIKKEAEERAKKRYEAIAAMPPPKRVDPYVTKVSD